MADPAESPDFGSLEDEIHLPAIVLCLQTPGTDGTDMIVHREDREDYVFLFESLDDASDYALAAQNALGYAPQIGRVRIEGLRFRMARYKPAVGEQVDIPLRSR